jgi:hypothetical protein
MGNHSIGLMSLPLVALLSVFVMLLLRPSLAPSSFKALESARPTSSLLMWNEAGAASASDAAALSTSGRLLDAGLVTWELPHIPFRRQSRVTRPASSSDASTAAAPSMNEVHMVFMGDSVMRYQYLDFVYRVHCAAQPSLSSTHATTSAGACEPPTSLLHVLERKEGVPRHRPDFMAFHRFSTAMFNGTMSCDCSRKPLKFPALVDSLIENRCYRHPTRLFRASFIQLFGDVPLLSRARLDLLNVSNDLPANARIAEVDHKLDTFYFKKTSFLSFAQNVAPAMVPRPTHFILNMGIWDFREVLKDLPLAVQALRGVADHVVWRETSQPSPKSGSINTKHQRQRWLRRTHHNQKADVLMQRLCDEDQGRVVNGGNSPLVPRRDALPANATTTRNIRAHQSSSIHQEKHHQQKRQRLCYYFAIDNIMKFSNNDTAKERSDRGAMERPNVSSELLPEALYFDRLHPHPVQYKRWNSELLPFLVGLSRD